MFKPYTIYEIIFLADFPSSDKSLMETSSYETTTLRRQTEAATTESAQEGNISIVHT